MSGRKGSAKWAYLASALMMYRRKLLDAARFRGMAAGGGLRELACPFSVCAMFDCRAAAVLATPVVSAMMCWAGGPSWRVPIGRRGATSVMGVRLRCVCCAVGEAASALPLAISSQGTGKSCADLRLAKGVMVAVERSSRKGQEARTRGQPVQSGKRENKRSAIHTKTHNRAEVR